MDKKREVIYFSVNNWFEGVHYPPTKNFRKWLSDDSNQMFADDEWTRKNKLCVYYGILDMSINYTVSATKEWVEKYCPELLTDDEYTYNFGGKIEHVKYSNFVYIPEKKGGIPENDNLGNMPFREYCEENFGSQYYETDYWGNEDEESDEDIDG